MPKRRRGEWCVGKCVEPCGARLAWHGGWVGVQHARSGAPSVRSLLQRMIWMQPDHFSGCLLLKDGGYPSVIPQRDAMLLFRCTYAFAKRGLPDRNAEQ